MLLRRPRPRRSVEFEFVDPRVGRSRSCQNIDSSVVEKMVTSWSQTKSGRLFDLPQVIENNDEPWRARTSDPLIKSVLKRSPAGYGPYDLLTFVTGCSRQRVYLLPLSKSSLLVVLSQVCRKLIRSRAFASLRRMHFLLRDQRPWVVNAAPMPPTQGLSQLHVSGTVLKI